MKEQIARSIADVKMGTPVSPDAIKSVRSIYAEFHESEPK